MRNVHPRPWRRGSDYAPPPRRAMDRDQRHVWRRRTVAEARAGNLPAGAILTAEALLACLGEDGALYPSQEAIALKAGVSKRSVARHIDRLVELGLILKHRRLVRLPWPEGGRGATRVQQTSNAYELIFPQGHVVPKPRRLRFNTGCHNGAEQTGKRISLGMEMDRSEALRGLEQVRLARASVLMASWTSRVPRCSESSRTGAALPPLRDATHP